MVLKMVYDIHTRFGDLDVAVPFICQKCGRCCTLQAFASAGFFTGKMPEKLWRECKGKIREFLEKNKGKLETAKCPFLTEKNLCSVHRFKPEGCKKFPLQVDFWYSAPMSIGCQGFLRFLKLRSAILSGYNCYSGSSTKRRWKKLPRDVYQHFRKKLLTANPTVEELRLFERLNLGES